MLVEVLDEKLDVAPFGHNMEMGLLAISEPDVHRAPMDKADQPSGLALRTILLEVYSGMIMLRACAPPLVSAESRHHTGKLARLVRRHRLPASDHYSSHISDRRSISYVRAH